MIYNSNEFAQILAPIVGDVVLESYCVDIDIGKSVTMVCHTREPKLVAKEVAVTLLGHSSVRYETTMVSSNEIRSTLEVTPDAFMAFLKDIVTVPDNVQVAHIRLYVNEAAKINFTCYIAKESVE